MRGIRSETLDGSPDGGPRCGEVDGRHLSLKAQEEQVSPDLLDLHLSRPNSTPYCDRVVLQPVGIGDYRRSKPT